MRKLQRQILFALFLLPVSVSGADYASGRLAYANGDVPEALRIWRPLAEAGDPRAQFSIGNLYFNGIGVGTDRAEAARWFRLAADQGHASAQFNLGNAYKHGHGVPHNDRAAVRWWSQAAQQELAPAQYNLGTQYYFGRGVPQDENEARKWYRRAAENGHPRAKRVIALLDEWPPPSKAHARDDEALRAAGSDSSTDSVHREQWLLAQRPSDYTVQILSAHSEQGILDFIRAHDLQHEVAYFQHQRSGKMWFSLVYGIYATGTEARGMMEKLPPDLLRASPWVRQLSDIQKTIQATMALSTR